MAMSTGGGGDETPMSDINTTPLVDVMLVLLIIFLIAIPVAIQNVDQLEIPILENEKSDDSAENVLLSISATDDAGRAPNTPGYTGASQNGECMVYLQVTPVDSQQLYDFSLKRMESFIESRGGVENIDPDDVPEVHIRSDVNTPWQCIGGAIYQMQAAGYPAVGFISNPQDPNPS
ncbi:biopolymer transporter ExbD [Sphingorhabdus sp. Alg239-R122]|uniref:ExbD/TolR family protein n=1 Tax=Sphingorhabdus sp. Alg239-R122 TaxID=2305989 RepID=UPI00196757A2|nr:biopolymer transporter ExbD [Sphingorhabdus sp. Alg239-R122]